jgi:hypothetical protein
MKISFKAFLLEGGAATAKYDVQRATKADIEKALEIVGSALGIQDIKERLLGSTELTLLGKKSDSGDIDIAITPDEMDMEAADQKMLQLTNNQGALNKGTKVGSYAVDVGGKKVQVDLMFVSNKEWAKFIYHSSEGNGSQYPGVVRNLLLMAVTRHTHVPGKDVIVKKNDEVIARASRAIKLDVGLERLFKMAKQKKDGTYSKGMDKVEPEELKKHIDGLAGRDVKFDPTPDIIDTPDEVAAWLFGPDTKAADIMTAEQVIEKIKKHKNANVIINDAKKSLVDANVPVPKELG